MRILALDLSTSCTGWALFEPGPKLVEYGSIKSSVAGLSKLNGISKTHAKMWRLADQIDELVNEKNPDLLVIEEIAGSRSRLTQKTLDGFHWLVYHHLGYDWMDKIVLYDVTGLNGWRTQLNLRLSEADKEQNKEAKKLNKKLSKAQQIPKVGPKDLSVRYVNARYNLSFTLDKNDIADAISMGDAYMRFHFKKS